MKGSDVVSEFLDRIESQVVFGLSGANCEDVFQSIQQKGKSKIILTKTEYGASTMAIGHYLAHKKIGVVITTSGPGVLNTIPVLSEAFTSRIPMLLIAGAVPLALEGKGAFQDTSGKEGSLDLEKMLSACTCILKKIEDEKTLFEDLIIAYEKAMQDHRPAVVLLPRDIAQRQIEHISTYNQKTESKINENAMSEAIYFCESAASSQYHPLVVFGDDCLHLKNSESLLRLVESLDALVVVTPNAKGLVDHQSKRFAGLLGIMGHESARSAFIKAEHVLFIGHEFNALNNIGIEDHLPHKNKFVLSYRESGDLEIVVSRLSSFNFKEEKKNIREMAEGDPPAGFTMENIIAEIQNSLSKNYKDCNVFVDAGNTGAYVVHHFKCTGRGLFSISLGMGGMGNSVGAAIGAASLKSKRSAVFIGDGSFFIQGMEVHTALQYSIPVTFFILNNNAHGMCATRENLFLKGDTGLNRFKVSFFASGILKMFPGIPAREIHSIEELQECLSDFKNARGPVVISINIQNTENPPFLTFKGR